MRKLILATLAGCLMLAGCGRQETPLPVDASAAAASLPPPASAPIARKFSRSDWISTFESTFDKRDPKQDGDGVTKYLATFQGGSVAFGRTDAFNRLHSLTPIQSEIHDIADLSTFVKVAVVAIECQSPRLVLMPRYNAKGGWLFMDRVAILADGDLALEHTFENRDISRDHANSWVSEKATWIADDKDLQGIQTILSAKKTIGRISGSKGYVTIERKMQDRFVQDVRDAVSIMEALTTAFLKTGGAHCTS